MSLECPAKDGKYPIHWASMLLHTCIYEYTQVFGTLFGLLSILCWVSALLPQIFKNARLKTTEGISLYFVLQWVLGDSFSLAGLILAHQLWYQICLGTYFILVDIVIFFQWAYYDYLGLSAISNISSVVFKGEQPQKASQPRSEMVQATAVTTETSPLMASSPSYSTHSMNSVNSDCSTAPLSLSVIHKKMTKLSIALATAATIITVVIYILTHSKAITNYVEYNREYIGQMFGWLCNIMYWSSRIPQAYKNYKRKSVSGVSFMTFLTIFSGNVTNCISIALQYPTAPDDYIRSSRPFIIGPAGSVFIDFFFLSQLLYYTELDKKRHRLAAKAGRMEDAVAE